MPGDSVESGVGLVPKPEIEPDLGSVVTEVASDPVDALAQTAATDPHGTIEGLMDLPEPPTPTDAIGGEGLGQDLKAAEAQAANAAQVAEVVEPSAEALDPSAAKAQLESDKVIKENAERANDGLNAILEQGGKKGTPGAIAQNGEEQSEQDQSGTGAGEGGEPSSDTSGDAAEGSDKPEGPAQAEGPPPRDPPTAEAAPSSEEPEESEDSKGKNETQSLSDKDLDEITAEGGDGAVKNAETGQPEPPPEQQQPKTPDETQKRIDELAQKDKDGTITPEELQEFKDLRLQSDEAKRLDELNSKDIKDLSDAEIDERNQLREKANKKGETEGELTQEQQAEARDKEIEDLGTEIMQKLANGEEVPPEVEDRIQKLIAEKKMAEAGFTPDQARAAAKAALEKKGSGSEKGSRRTQEAKEKIQELMSLELQLISQRNLARQLNEKRKTAIVEAREARDEANSAKPEERLRKKCLEYSKYMVVANYNGQIEGTKYSARRINARRVDLEQEVRRKIGVTGGLGALVEWSGAKINNVLTEIDILAEEKLPF